MKAASALARRGSRAVAASVPTAAPTYGPQRQTIPRITISHSSSQRRSVSTRSESGARSFSSTMSPLALNGAPANCAVQNAWIGEKSHGAFDLRSELHLHLIHTHQLPESFKSDVNTDN